MLHRVKVQVEICADVRLPSHILVLSHLPPGQRFLVHRTFSCRDAKRFHLDDGMLLASAINAGVDLRAASETLFKRLYFIRSGGFIQL